MGVNYMLDRSSFNATSKLRVVFTLDGKYWMQWRFV